MTRFDYSKLYCAYSLEACFFERTTSTTWPTRGTCFFIASSKKIVLVTSRHLLDKGYGTSSHGKFRLVSIKISGKMHDERGTPNSTVTISEGANDLGKLFFSRDEGNDVAIYVSDAFDKSRIHYAIPKAALMPRTQFSTSLDLCDMVVFPGYPEWHDNVSGRPIFRFGVIASDPRYMYANTLAGRSVGGECLAYEAFSFGGSSGSPVFSLPKGRLRMGVPDYETVRPMKLIGVNAGHLTGVKADAEGDYGVHHSGISYFYRSSVVLDIVESISN